MRAWIILLMMIPLSAAGSAACGGNIVRDWGLHLEWTVERDCEHLERPARLREIPWTIATRVAARGAGPGSTAVLPPPEVHSGMIVTLCHRSDEADIHLSGTALGAARTGERVRVKTRFSSAPLEGIVRGPGLVELSRRRSGN
jgi:hypothetical protein